MKRLWRWLFNLAAAVSLVLAIVLAVDRVTHAWRPNACAYYFVHTEGPACIAHGYSIQSRNGQVIFGHTMDRFAASEKRFTTGFHWGGNFTGPIDGTYKSLLGRLGFGTAEWEGEDVPDSKGPIPQVPDVYSFRAMAIPSWFLVLLFLILPAIWVRRYLHRIPPGRCQVCVYDLRATPDRCPECGAVPKGAKGAAISAGQGGGE